MLPRFRMGDASPSSHSLARCYHSTCPLFPMNFRPHAHILPAPCETACLPFSSYYRIKLAPCHHGISTCEDHPCPVRMTAKALLMSAVWHSRLHESRSTIILDPLPKRCSPHSPP